MDRGAFPGNPPIEVQKIQIGAFRGGFENAQSLEVD
jgi:hypothetical protein